MRISDPVLGQALIRWVQTPRYGHWFRAAVILWSLVLVVVAVKCVLKPNMHAVYPTYATAARVNWRLTGWEHTPSSSYVTRQYGLVFSDLMIGFAVLDDRIGGALWSVASIVLLLSGFRSFFRNVAPANWAHCEFGACLCLLPWFGLASLYNGQFNVAITGFLLWGVSLCQQEKWWRAALIFALPAAIKVYPIAVPLVFCVMYPRQFVLRFAICLTAVCLFPFLLHRWDFVAELYRQRNDYLQSGLHYTLALVRVDLRTVIERWIGPVSTQLYLPFQLLTGLLVAMLMRFRPSPESKDAAQAAYILTAFWMVLFGPATEEATYLLAGPAAALLLVNAFTEQGVSLLAMVLSLSALVAGPLQTSILGETVRKAVLDWKLAPLGLLVLFIFTVAKEVKLQRSRRLPAIQPITLAEVPSRVAL